MEDLGIRRCDSADCHGEMQDLGIESALVVVAQETGHGSMPTTTASATNWQWIAGLLRPERLPLVALLWEYLGYRSRRGFEI